MTYDEMYRKVLDIFPYAQMGEDSEGQLIVYTDMRVVGDQDELVSFNLDENE